MPVHSQKAKMVSYLPKKEFLSLSVHDLLQGQKLSVNKKLKHHLLIAFKNFITQLRDD